MKIAVAGTGYVGLSIATLLAQKNEVVAYNRHQEKCDKLNNRISLIQDNEIEEFFRTKELNLFATPDYNCVEQCCNAGYNIVFHVGENQQHLF